jgi:hypothetical protein
MQGERAFYTGDSVGEKHKAMWRSLQKAAAVKHYQGTGTFMHFTH